MGLGLHSDGYERQQKQMLRITILFGWFETDSLHSPVVFHGWFQTVQLSVACHQMSAKTYALPAIGPHGIPSLSHLLSVLETGAYLHRKFLSFLLLQDTVSGFPLLWHHTFSHSSSALRIGSTYENRKKNAFFLNTLSLPSASSPSLSESSFFCAYFQISMVLTAFSPFFTW